MYLFNFPATYSRTLIWLVCIDPQLPEEVFEMMNFVATSILVDLSSKQQVSLLPVISATDDRDNLCFHTTNGHSRVEDICRFVSHSQIAFFEQELHLVASKLL